jgi:hypothetical protein
MQEVTVSLDGPYSIQVETTGKKYAYSQLSIKRKVSAKKQVKSLQMKIQMLQKKVGVSW